MPLGTDATAARDVEGVTEVWGATQVAADVAVVGVGADGIVEAVVGVAARCGGFTGAGREEVGATSRVHSRV